MRSLAPIAGLLAFALAVLGSGGEAHAIGGYVGRAEDGTAVTDHRVVVALGDDSTTVWDQLQWSGKPADFVWILPTPAPATLELADPRFFVELEALTRPEVMPPRSTAITRGSHVPEGAASAVGCGGIATAELNPVQPFADVVTVFHQGQLGPYETVAVAVDPAAAEDAPARLDAWLRPRGFALPSSLGPALRDYAARGWVFNLLRLRDGEEGGATQVTPVRATYAGRVPSLPVRLAAAAGSADAVTLTVWVVAEERQSVRGWDTVSLDETRLRWITRLGRSTYRDVYADTIAAHNGRALVTEYAQPLVAEALTDGADRALLLRGQPASAVMTRLRATVTPSLLDETDLTLVAAETQEAVDNHHFLTAAQVIETSSLGGAAGFIGLVLAALRCVRSRRAARR